MIRSMTGFARRESSSPFGQLTCELRSVNHRYLEPGFRLPEELRGLEGDLRQRLSKTLRRGKVDCTMHLRSTQGAERELLIDDAAADRLLARVVDLQRRLPSQQGATLRLELDPLEVLRWPGVLRDVAPDAEGLAEICRSLFDDALRDIATHREREGARLKELIEQRCDALAALVETVRTRMPELRLRLRERLRQRVAELGTEVEAARFEQEVVLLLQRADVDEELDRLSGHLTEIRHVVAGEESAGRRLDFLMQELNREANTLSSKSSELDMTRLAVDMKVLIEQMREQVQNIE